MDFKLIDRILALGNLIAHAQLAYVEAGTDLQISSWNQAAGDLFGYCEERQARAIRDVLIFEGLPGVSPHPPSLFMLSTSHWAPMRETAQSSSPPPARAVTARAVLRALEESRPVQAPLSESR